MSDRRLTPDPALIETHAAAQVVVPVADLCQSPGGARDRQLLFGAPITVLRRQDGWAYVQATRDGYCGHLSEATLGPAGPATHKVIAGATHVYAQANLKSPDRMALSHGSLLSVTAMSDHFAETPAGFVPVQHIETIDRFDTDPVAVAEKFLGTPYLWGGNSRFGIDCSGLVQAACHACGIECPGDSDMQAATLGTLLPADMPAERGDLLFWKGHVAWVVDSDTILHANGGSMSVAHEPMAVAIARIAAQGEGPVTARKRL